MIANVHWWHWTAVQLASVVSAVAAIAAFLSTRVSLALQRASRVPQVSGAVLHDTQTGRLQLTFANAGPPLAIQVVYMLVAEGEWRGGLVGNGHLSPGQQTTFDAGISSPNHKREAWLVWGWRDLDDNVYLRNSDWRPKRISRRAYLKRKDMSIAAMFSEMYPTVEIPRQAEDEIRIY